MRADYPKWVQIESEPIEQNKIIEKFSHVNNFNSELSRIWGKVEVR